jgi:anti-anti-sigma factor
MAARNQKGPTATTILEWSKGVPQWSITSLNQPTPPPRPTKTGLKFRESWIDRIVVLSVCDTVDILSAPRLTEAIRDAPGKGPVGLIVDLTEVEFLASIGMSVLLAAQEEADAVRAQFGVVAEGAATSRPIRLLGIAAILALYPTIDDALRDYR